MGKKSAKRAAEKAQAQQAEQAARQQAAAKKKPAVAATSDTPKKRRNRPAIIISIVVIALIGGIVIAAGIQAQKQPGARIENERGVGMLLGDAEPKETAKIAIVLKEGESPQQAVNPVLGSMKGARGVDEGIILNDGSAAEITYDPAYITESEIASFIRDAGYLRE